VSLECRPAAEMVETYGGDRRTLLYVDPPYDAQRSRNYGLEMSAAEHRELATLCRDAEAAVVVSGYPGGVWDAALAQWNRVEVPAVTTQGGRAGERLEVVWCNRDMQLSDSSIAMASVDESVRCPACLAIIRQPKTGRRRKWCSASCRTTGWRVRRDTDPHFTGGLT
jgi:DNA adenine methylase